MLPDADEWAMVEPPGPAPVGVEVGAALRRPRLQHLLAHVLRRRPRHASRGHRYPRRGRRSGAQRVPHLGLQRRRIPRAADQALLLRRGLPGLDFMISTARTHKTRLIMALCNNWEDYGGKPQYISWGKEAGLDLTSDDDFFSDPTIKSYYKPSVEAVLTRINTITNEAYKDDSCLGAD